MHSGGLLAGLVIGCADGEVMLALLGDLSDRRALALVLLHVGLALAGTFVVVLATAPRSRRDARALAALAALLALLVPPLGAVGLHAALWAGVAASRPRSREPWVRVRVDPDLDDRAWQPRTRRRDVDVATLEEELQNLAPERADYRFQALVRLKYVSPQASVVLLKVALKDPSDEVRLFAFSRLERMRDELEQAMKGFRAALASAADDSARALAHLRIAETHWEMAYLGLAEGAVRGHALASALEHVSKSCAVPERSAPAEFLRGRVLLQLRELSGAMSAFERALAGGHPAATILPYLAECAFEQRSVKRVRGHLRALDEVTRDHARLDDVMEFWR